MTITFRCDSCGVVMAYDEDRSVLFNSSDKERRKDLCPECSGIVEQYIDEGYDAILEKRRKKK